MDKRNKLLLVLIAVISVLVVATVSYAMFNMVYTVGGSGDIFSTSGTVNTTGIDVEMTNASAGISLSGTYPMDATTAEDKVAPFTFSLVNHDTSKTAKVYIYLLKIKLKGLFSHTF